MLLSKDKRWCCRLLLNLLWCSGIVFLRVCCRSAAAKHEGRRGRGEGTSIRGLICSDYKWLPSVGQTGGSVLSCGSKIISKTPSGASFILPDLKASRADLALPSHLTAQKTAASLLLQQINWDVRWRNKDIMSSLYVSVDVGGFFLWSWPHVESTKAVLMVTEKDNVFSINLF